MMMVSATKIWSSVTNANRRKITLPSNQRYEYNTIVFRCLLQKSQLRTIAWSSDYTMARQPRTPEPLLRTMSANENTFLQRPSVCNKLSRTTVD